MILLNKSYAAGRWHKRSTFKASMIPGYKSHLRMFTIQGFINDIFYCWIIPLPVHRRVDGVPLTTFSQSQLNHICKIFNFAVRYPFSLPQCQKYISHVKKMSISKYLFHVFIFNDTSVNFIILNVTYSSSFNAHD
jgi:hypothetical protein